MQIMSYPAAMCQQRIVLRWKPKWKNPLTSYLDNYTRIIIKRGQIASLFIIPSVDYKIDWEQELQYKESMCTWQGGVCNNYRVVHGT